VWFFLSLFSSTSSHPSKHHVVQRVSGEKGRAMMWNTPALETQMRGPSLISLASIVWWWSPQEPADQGRLLKAGVVMWDQYPDPSLNLRGGLVSKELLHQSKAAGGAHGEVVSLHDSHVAGGLDQRTIDHRPGERAPLIWDILQGPRAWTWPNWRVCGLQQQSNNNNNNNNNNNRKKAMSTITKNT